LDKQSKPVLQAAIKAALGGDTSAMRLLLDKLMPKERLIKIDLPRVRSASGAMEALSRILSAVVDGQITPSEGSAISVLARNYLELSMAQRLDERLSAIEAKLGAASAPGEPVQ
jgi:hypothetical protein